MDVQHAAIARNFSYKDLQYLLFSCLCNVNGELVIALEAYYLARVTHSRSEHSRDLYQHLREHREKAIYVRAGTRFCGYENEGNQRDEA